MSEPGGNPWPISDHSRAAPHPEIRQYVEREEKREAFRQDGIRARNEYQATGLSVTMEEADAWLAKLEAGQDVEPPECYG